MNLFDKIKHRLNEDPKITSDSDRIKNKKYEQGELFDTSKTGKKDPVKDVKTTRDIIGNRKRKGRPIGSKNKNSSSLNQNELPYQDKKTKELVNQIDKIDQQIDNPDQNKIKAKKGEKSALEQQIDNLIKKREKYKDDLAKSKGITGINPGKKLEKQIEIGARKQDTPIGKKSTKAFAQGRPFQPDNNPFTKSGKYETSGKTILNKRYQYQTDIKASEVDAVKSRLKDRIKYLQDPNFSDPKKIDKFVNDITKNQKLSKLKGKKSSLYKTVKADIDARNPTIKGSSGGKLPMPDGLKKDEIIKKKLQKLDDKLVKQANIPSGTVLPKGGVPADFNKKTFTAPLEPKELNLKYKADKLKLDYGGRIAQRDGLTNAERAAKLKEIKRKIDIKNPTVTSPISGGQLPAGQKKSVVTRFGTYVDNKSLKNRIIKVKDKPKNFKKLMQYVRPLYKPLKNRVMKNKKAATVIGSALAVAGGIDYFRNKARKQEQQKLEQTKNEVEKQKIENKKNNKNNKNNNKPVPPTTTNIPLSNRMKGVKVMDTILNISPGDRYKESKVK